MTVALAACGWILAGALGAAVLLLRARLELVARAEHELRGPVTVLVLAAERLRRELGGRSRADPLEAEVERLRAGLSDLAAARLGRRAAVRQARLDLEAFVRGAAAGWRPALGGAGRELTVDWHGGPAPIASDRGRLAQAIGNLLANAVEHGAGPVAVAGRRVAGGVRLEVRSGEGRGVPPSAPPAGGPTLRAALRRRRRRPRRRDRGRGLPIAASAAKAVGGRLELAREDGVTVAALELPARDGEPPAAA